MAGVAAAANRLNGPVALWACPGQSSPSTSGGSVAPRHSRLVGWFRVARIAPNPAMARLPPARRVAPDILMPTHHPMAVSGLAAKAAEARAPVSPTIVALVPRAAAGDEAAFTQLVEEFHADMARLAYFICGGNRELSEDAVQSAWTIAWGRLSSLRDHQRIRSWLLSVAANEARQAMRRQRRAAAFGIEFAEDRVGAAGPYPSAIALDIADVLARLKPEERTLIGLRYATNLDSAEIGAVLGISASGVRSRLNRLLDRLRAELRQ